MSNKSPLVMMYNGREKLLKQQKIIFVSKIIPAKTPDAILRLTEARDSGILKPTIVPSVKNMLIPQKIQTISRISSIWHQLYMP